VALRHNPRRGQPAAPRPTCLAVERFDQKSSMPASNRLAFSTSVLAVSASIGVRRPAALSSRARDAFGGFRRRRARALCTSITLGSLGRACGFGREPRIPVPSAPCLRSPCDVRTYSQRRIRSALISLSCDHTDRPAGLSDCARGWAPVPSTCMFARHCPVLGDFGPVTTAPRARPRAALDSDSGEGRRTISTPLPGFRRRQHHMRWVATTRGFATR